MDRNQTKRVVALGFFDGVHLGHAALLRTARQAALRLRAVPAAVTFDAHPETLVSKTTVPLITSPADREGLMRRLYGMEDVIVAHFDRAMMEMPWQDFITRFLVAGHGAVHLVAGHDFHFGYRGEGDPRRLTEKCRELGLGCDIIPPVQLDGITVSSTYIRTLIAQGDMETAARFLGHPHVLSGTVAHGKGLGRDLGFPTVNLSFPPGILVPARGVYAARVFLEGGGECPAAVNIGVRPTVDRCGAVNAEGFLLDFSGDLYGRRIRMEFHRRLRGEEKFPSLDALRAQILRDAANTRACFAS